MVRFVRPGIRSLDVGAGAGANGAWLAAFGELIAVAPEYDALTAYREIAPSAYPMQSRFDDLAVADRSIDVVMGISALHNDLAGDPRAIVAEYSRVLVPGGGVAMLEPAPSIMRRTNQSRCFSLPTLVGYAEASGLKVIRQTYANLSPFIEGVAETGAYRLGLDEVLPSDLSWGSRFTRNMLWVLAGLERTFLMRRGLAFGSSVLVVACKPGDDGDSG